MEDFLGGKTIDNAAPAPSGEVEQALKYRISKIRRFDLNKKAENPVKSRFSALRTGVPERIRTAGLPLRRRTLYPAELQKRI